MKKNTAKKNTETTKKKDKSSDKKNTQNNKSDKKTKNDTNVKNNKNEKSKSQSKSKNSPQKNEKINSKEKDEQNKNTLKQKPVQNFNLDFIYRREQYKLKNLKISATFKQIKEKISNEIKVPSDDLQVFYKNNELKNDEQKIYDVFKNNKIYFLEVKKQIKNLNTFDTFDYKVEIKNIENGYDLNKQIDNFFNQLLLEKKVLCEPIDMNVYHVCFNYEDIAFDFKRYILVLKRTNKIYENVEVKTIIPNESIKKSSLLLSNLNKKKNFISAYYVNQGPYLSDFERKNKENKNDKKNWINKKGFISSVGNSKKPYEY
jgi:hypothetical protein